MTDPNNWIGIGNISCLIPIVILLIQYVLRTDWKTTETGRALALLITLSFVNFSINLMGTLTEGVFWDWFRVSIKFGIAVGLFNLVRVMEKARNEAIVKAEVIEQLEEKMKDDERRD